jgi:hypothetical protein
MVSFIFCISTQTRLSWFYVLLVAILVAHTKTANAGAYQPGWKHAAFSLCMDCCSNEIAINDCCIRTLSGCLFNHQNTQNESITTIQPQHSFTFIDCSACCHAFSVASYDMMHKQKKFQTGCWDTCVGSSLSSTTESFKQQLTCLQGCDECVNVNQFVYLWILYLLLICVSTFVFMWSVATRTYQAYRAVIFICLIILFLCGYMWTFQQFKRLVSIDCIYGWEWKIIFVFILPIVLPCVCSICYFSFIAVTVKQNQVFI